MSGFTLNFDAAGGDDAALVGGKGVNLSRLTKAGFDVPPGFTITTDAYGAFIDANKLWPKIDKILGKVDYDDADDQETNAAKIRALIEAAPVPDAIAKEIAAGYKALGKDPYVAVRSSGTAEDLAGASFAGQHDTYLDIRTRDGLIDAVRRCWASLWTTRAVAYRQRGGFDHGKVRIAIVIQKMIESEVSGVMFTANPMTAAVDEYMVNASYGLGEAIVAGIITPDMFRLNRDDGSTRETTIGSKKLKIVRNPKGKGTVELEVDTADQERPCLDEPQLRILALLGSRVMEYYEGYPQDIEWAFADGQFYLLQSRDVTGVDLSWDEDLDEFDTLPKEDGTIWTRAWSDGVWTGAVTPFMYSWRGGENARSNRKFFSELWGIDWAQGRRIYKYHKGFVFYNSKSDYLALKDMIAPSMRRDELLENLPPEWRKSILKEPFSWTKFMMIWARIALLYPENSPWKCWDPTYDVIEREHESAHGLPPEQIRLLSDEALKKYLQARIVAEPAFSRLHVGIFYLHVPVAMGLMHKLVVEWLGDKDPTAVSDLLAGSPFESATMRENKRMQELAEIIDRDPKLKTLFESHPGRAFFDEAASIPEGKHFTERYAAFIKDYGHRGHADRDVWFERRAENPALDYAALSPMIGLDFAEGEAKAKIVAERRQALTDAAVAKIRALPFGDIRAQAFLWLQNWLMRFWQLRDDERAHVDKVTFSIKRAVLEMGRRMKERGLFERESDCFFLSKLELFALYDSGKVTRLVREKIKARRRNHTNFKVEFYAPMYMLDDAYVDLDAPEEDDGNPNVLKGMGTSKGKYTGRARIVPTQKDIGLVKKGEILICPATDPGWTPVFLVISGLVLETGGMLAHGSLISREYGIPAVQINNAMKRIPDGALITVDGTTGKVTIEEEPEQAIAAE